MRLDLRCDIPHFQISIRLCARDNCSSLASAINLHYVYLCFFHFLTHTHTHTLLIFMFSPLFQICSSNGCRCNKFSRSRRSGRPTNRSPNTPGWNTIFVSPAIHIIMAPAVRISVGHVMINSDTTLARRLVKLSALLAGRERTARNVSRD